MIYKNTITALLTGILAFGLTGCFEEEMTCDNQVTQSLVQELSMPTVANAIFFKKYEAGEYGEPNYLATMTLNQADGNVKEVLENMKSLLSKKGGDFIFENMLQGITKIEENIKVAAFSMDSFMTTKKNKELGQVECSASAHYSLDKVNYNFNTTYVSQFTDDREQVSVELHSFDIK